MGKKAPAASNVTKVDYKVKGPPPQIVTMASIEEHVSGLHVPSQSIHLDDEKDKEFVTKVHLTYICWLCNDRKCHTSEKCHFGHIVDTVQPLQSIHQER